MDYQDKVTVRVSQETALKNGTTKWGDLFVEDFDVLLSELSVEEREFLQVDQKNRLMIKYPVSFGRSPIPVIADSGAIGDVAKAVRKWQKRVWEAVEKEKSEAREKLSAILEDPRKAFDEYRLERTWSYTPDRIKKLCETAGVSFEAHENALERTLESLTTLWQNQVLAELDNGTRNSFEVFGSTITRRKVWEVAKNHKLDSVINFLQKLEEELEQGKIKTENEKALSQQEWVDFVVNLNPQEWNFPKHEDLIFSIKEGYPVWSTLNPIVCEFFQPFVETEFVSKLKINDDLGDRRVPRETARKLREELVEKVVDLKHLEPKRTTVEVGRIRLVELWIECDCGGEMCGDCDDGEVLVKRTAVPVTIKAPHFELTSWYVIVEDYDF